MSGRGLGYTGGTIDKLESIPGYRTVLSRQEFFDTVNQCGLSLIGQSGNLAPADKKLYALRDVTATVDSIPLIASSIIGSEKWITLSTYIIHFSLPNFDDIRYGYFFDQNYGAVSFRFNQITELIFYRFTVYDI